ncbi:BTB/POZ and TAZ domain-containing protein 4-like [Cynara cardunculus var. scolymus]|uniref:BTB/POZ and TAZ domain-containing protein 4-like n=1 Tax=Cynara cardunculus var. scolymus TaxID=59895 RepID=UPI000D62FEC4|nr:BTB/POZ and TAZ domain-containing protein 4-like [Cynara cardunculus var. scolymus]
MGSSYEESPVVVAKDAPVPPPLPSASSTTTMKTHRTTFGRRSCCVSAAMSESWDRLFDDAYRADVSIYTSSDDIIYAHSSILGLASPVFRGIFNRKSRSNRPFSVPIRGVPAEAVRIFIRFLYSSCYEEYQMEEHILSLLVLSHAYVVPRLKRECEHRLEHKFLNIDNVVDVFQLALLCDAPRLSIICHRIILKNFKAASSSEAWKAMKTSHPILEKELLETVADEANRQKEKAKKVKERKIYLELYEAMEALVHICRDGCRTIGPHDKVLNEHQEPCSYEACKGLESLIRHFAACKLRVPGGCIHCKRMWQLLELHSRLCIDSNTCKVPLCKNLKEKTKKQKKKDDIMWKILVKKILRSKSITGAPYFSLSATM